MSIQEKIQTALNILPDRNKLAVLISKRVKQLSHGAHPLVEVNRGNDDYMDIAINEIIENKIWYQSRKNEI